MDNKSFWLMSNSLTSNEDVKVLSLLYQPLIGTESLGLYLCLINLVNPNNLQTDVYPIQYLLDLLNFNFKTLEQSLHKLEAIGLLTTFLKENIYLFRVNMPLKARQFFLDGILGSYLKSEIGEINFELLFSYFSVPEISKKGYKNITKAFDDVYEIKNLDLLTSDQFVFGRKGNSGIVIKEAFDFESFYETLPIRLKKKRLYTKKIISQIASAMYVYNLTNQEMIKILSLAYDDNENKIFAQKISVLASDYFRKTYGENQIKIEKKPKNEEEINLSAIRPQDIIKLFGGEMTNHSYALETIFEFIERNAVDIGLINGVILVSLKYNEKWPSLAYLEKVLADWLSRGIKTAEDAMLILKQVESRPKQTFKRKPKQKENDEPAWLDEIIASFREEDKK